MRLNKYLSDAGVCSRREADRLAEAGEITVNGKHVSVQEEIAGVEYRRRGTGIVSYGLE